MGEHQFRENGSHYNGGAMFFGYGFDAIGEPRLRMVRRWYRQGERRGQSEDHFSVDGRPVDSYAAAVVALKTPPELTGEERSALVLFGDEPARRPAVDFEVVYRLRAKGFVKARDGLYSLTESGRTALANSTPDQTGEESR